MGIQNLKSKTYIKDKLKMANKGSMNGYTYNGELWIVHRKFHARGSVGRTVCREGGTRQGNLSPPRTLPKLGWSQGSPVVWSR